MYHAAVADVDLVVEGMQRAEFEGFIANFKFRLRRDQTISGRVAVVELQFAARGGHAQQVLNIEPVGARRHGEVSRQFSVSFSSTIVGCPVRSMRMRPTFSVASVVSGDPGSVFPVGVDKP